MLEHSFIFGAGVFHGKITAEDLGPSDLFGWSEGTHAWIAGEGGDRGRDPEHHRIGTENTMD